MSSRADPSEPSGWLVDAALYAASAAFAATVAAAAAIPLQRSWGRVAVWAYVGGAVVTLAGAAVRARVHVRAAVALAVFAGAAAAPLALAAADRSPDDRGGAAQSEVLILEEGATALLDGRDPYAERYDDGPLASRPPATRTHLPYPPVMLLFGLPKALGGAGPWTDARVWFLLASLAVAVPSVLAMRTDAAGRLLVLQTLAVLPTGALLLATGGHDVPVLAVLLGATVLADRGRAAATGLVAGAALALRQTSILAIPFLLAVLPPPRRLRAGLLAAVPAAVLSIPFLAWDARAFLEDTVLFPLGLGDAPSSARTPTLGSLLLSLVPGARTPLTILLVATIVGIVVVLVAVRPPRTAAGASARVAAASAATIALAPAARFGYLVYPASFLVWSLALRRGAQAAPEPETASDVSPAGGDPATSAR
jgi:hypothetical protein